MKLIIFGSGNIGRSLIPEVFYDHHPEIYFIDIDEQKIKLLNSVKKYNINRFGKLLPVDNYCALNSIKQQDKVLEVIYDADLITTSLGFNNLPKVADLLNKLDDSKFKKTVDLICFENNVRPSSELKKMVKSQKINFIDAVVDRIVPSSQNPDSLDVYCEPYYNVTLEKNNHMNHDFYNRCKIVNNLDESIKLKLFLVNGLHFIISVLGYNKGYKTIEETLTDKEIIDKVNKLKDIYLKVLPTMLKNTPLTYIEEFIDNSIKRFKQKELHDENTRIARNFILKMQENNRVIPIYIFLSKNKLEAEKEFFTSIIKELYNYDNPNDSDSVEIQKSIKDIGLVETILKYSDIKI